MSTNDKKATIDPAAFEAATKAAQNSSDVYVHKFKKPFSYNNKEYSELTFNWGNLKGADSLAIETELQQLGKPIIVASFSSEYMIRMAARSCSEPIGFDALEQMSLKDYNLIRSRARSFLLTSE